MTKSPVSNAAEPIKEITLMVNLKKPTRTHLTLWGREGDDTISWEDMFDITDIHVNGKPFHGLSDNKISIHFSFSSKPFKSRTLLEKWIGVGPSYQWSFFIGHEGHYCVFLDLDIARFDYVSNCTTLIISSRDMRTEDGKPAQQPLTYQQYTEQHVTSVASVVTFFRYDATPDEDGGGGPRKRKPQMTLQSYFDSMPEQHQVFN
jgi:hypothetical protein